MRQFNFTKPSITKLPAPDKGMVTYKDTKEKGLSLYITATGAITFFVRKRINGRDERIKLGAFPDLSVENARKKALQAKADIANGKNPNHDKNKMRDEITFQQLFNSYMERYSKKEKKSWQYDEREVNKFLSHWFKRKISTITKFEIQNLHEKIREENGLYQANRILERIRAIFNKAIEWGWEGKNPAQGIKKFKEKSRDRFIQPDEMPCLFRAIDEEESEVARDYIWLSLLTGARKSNVLAMRWNEISWERSEWRIPDTKNDEPAIIPLIERAVEILKSRQRKTNSEWVLPSPSRNSSTGHLADPKKAWKRILKRANLYLWDETPEYHGLISDASAKVNEPKTVDRLFDASVAAAKKKAVKLPTGLMDIRLHDIRRTLGSYQAITGSSLPVIGKSLGHKSQQATQIYSRLHLDPVRESMERATDSIFTAGRKTAR
jgi:integrase